ncbi:hypothetical protein [Euzebya sp.]|uniref:hypothetical protein n=1 Tax=Euzebya sp. TaxID=1971409 RepID=UPI003518481C
MSDDQRGGPPPLPPTGVTGAPPPPPAVGGPEGHAVIHQTEATRTYPCGTCGANLEFHIGTQRLQCPSCGTAQDLAEVSGTVEEQDLTSALRGLRDRTAEVEVVSGEKEIVCQSCGGHTTFTGTWTAQRCPYCATPIQRDDVHDAPDRLPVDGVLPFTIDRKAAEEALGKWVSSRWFAPSEFKDYSRAGSFSSVYSAYFTYDAETTTRYTGQRGDDRTETRGSGEDRETVTVTDWRHVSGTVHNSFDDVAVAANEGLNPKHVQSLEPWPLHQVQPFSPEFLAGHLSRTYDNSLEECFDTAKDRMEGTIDSTIRRDIGGDHQRIHTKDIRWSALTFKHLLLPIWLLTVIYAGQTYQVMINGTTGEVHGERPYSKVKIAAAVVVALIVLGIAAFLYFGSS